ncbi:LysR family transcriptional regulator [Pyruvatibacter sp.]|uniref:LysR family transcriptional regulator n=1 Tax=Pyruvatibacter sp. TaxID=1981328 RepID=UPI003267AB76
MQRNQLSDMSVFVEVARRGGFRAAAESLKQAPASVSDAIQRFEARLGVRLFERTTRKISLTTAGQRLYERSLPAICDLEGAIKDLNDAAGSVSGTLRLSAPRGSGTLFLDDLIKRYLKMYPDVQIELIYDDGKVDLVSSGIDATIRSHALVEEETHAVPVGPGLDFSLLASPDYLDRMGTPETPNDLVDHDGICFVFSNTGDLAPWTFEGPEGEYSVMPKAKLVLNDFDSMLRFAEDGFGLTYIYSYAARVVVKEKRLIPLFEGLIPSMHRYTINYLTKRHMPARLRAFIDLAKG